MLSEAQSFWEAISGKVKQLINSETENTYRCARYEVTTAPNGSVMGVTLPMGNNELKLPYSNEVADAEVGDPVMVVWWRSMSNAKVCYYADGYRGASSPAVTFTNVELAHGYERFFTISPQSRHVVFGVGTTAGSRFLAYFTRATSGQNATFSTIFSGGNNITITVQTTSILVSNNTQGDITISVMTVYGDVPTIADAEPI